MKIGDIIHSKIRPLDEYYRKIRLKTGHNPKRIPRKLKKKIKKKGGGLQFRVVSIDKSGLGSHTATLKPI